MAIPQLAADEETFDEEEKRTYDEKCGLCEKDFAGVISLGDTLYLPTRLNGPNSYEGMSYRIGDIDMPKEAMRFFGLAGALGKKYISFL